ncbi:MAG: amidohydrolase family protein [Pseudomonadota bacterium]
MSRLFLALALLCPTPALAAEDLRARTGATVWDGTGADPIPDAVVLIEGDHIRAVGPRATVRIPKKATVEDLSGAFIVPGLIDAHVHFFQTASLYTRPDIFDGTALRPYAEDQQHARASLEGTFARYLASGVTAVVDVGGPFWNFEVRDLARQGGAAPHVAVAGPLISTVSRPQLDLGDPPIIQAHDAEEARALARAQLARHPDLLKVWYIVDPEQGLEPGRPILEAVVAEGHAAGVRVMVHATELETARAAVTAGVDLLAHSIDDQPVDEAFLALLRERDVPLIGTLVVYEGYAEVLGQAVDLTPLEARLGDPWVRRTWSELAVADLSDEALAKNAARVERLKARGPVMAANLAAIQAAGLPVAAGTDAGNIGTLHGPSLHRELALMHAAGLSNRDVLLAATRDAARIFAAEPDIGTLAPGMQADLLVLDADPLQDLANLQRLRRVVLGGRDLEPAVLLPADPATVVQAQVEAYAARDLEAFLALYAEDAVLHRGLDDSDTVAGRATMREIYGPLFTDSPGLRIAIAAREVLGGIVVDHEVVTGMRGNGPIQAIAIYEVRDGLIQQVWFAAREE